MILLKVITLTLIVTSFSCAEEMDQSTMSASEDNQWRLSWSDELIMKVDHPKKIGVTLQVIRVSIKSFNVIPIR